MIKSHPKLCRSLKREKASLYLVCFHRVFTLPQLPYTYLLSGSFMEELPARLLPRWAPPASAASESLK